MMGSDLAYDNKSCFSELILRDAVKNYQNELNIFLYSPLKELRYIDMDRALCIFHKLLS